MNEPKAKSFRAAGDRILRQESTAIAGVTRLLTSRAILDRVIASEDDEWSLLLATLASLGQWDGVAVVADGPAGNVRAHNVSSRVALDAGISAAIREASRTGTAVQLMARVQLTDGRIADGVLVAPLRAVRGVNGSLIALRIGRGFGAGDAKSASSASEIAALEVFRSANVKRDAVTTRQALVLYELARQMMFIGDLAVALQSIVELLATSLEHDVAQIWSLRTSGSLQLRAAHPREGLVLEIARPRDHSALRQALSGELVRAHDPSLRSWVSRTTRDLIVAPLEAIDGPAGVLVFGRWRDVYASEDAEMAGACARFIAKALQLRGAWGIRSGSHGSADVESVEEPELTGS